MGLTPEFLLLIAVQIVSAGISIGVAKQTQRWHGERLNDLDRTKLDKAVHEVETTRIDSDLASLKIGYVSVDSRVRVIETRPRR